MTSSEDDMFTCHYRLQQNNNGPGTGTLERLLRKMEGWGAIDFRCIHQYHEGEANRQKALYSEALKYSQDWVLIIDGQVTSVQANKAFKDTFNLPQDDSPISPLELNFHRDKLQYYQSIFKSLDVGDHWRGEDELFTLSGEKYDVLINITVSSNPTSNEIYYLVF